MNSRTSSSAESFKKNSYMKKLANLLPKEDQKEIKLVNITSRLINLFIWILISLSVLILLTVATKFYLSSESGRVNDRIVLQEQVVTKEENQELKQKLTEFNTHLDNLEKLSDSHAVWSEVVVELARLAPQDMAIDSFLANRETGQISVTGFAKLRDSILDFRKNLLESEYFEDVNFPLANLVKPTDANFRYNFFVKEDILLESS